MVHIDMTKTGRDLSPGTDLWRVDQCAYRTSRKGDGMLEVKLQRVSNDADSILDWIMLEGGGWDIGKSKLIAFGVGSDYKGDLDPLSFVGRRLWVATTINSYQDKDGNPRESLRVDINELAHSGYQAEDDVPTGCTPPAAAPDDDTPF